MLDMGVEEQEGLSAWKGRPGSGRRNFDILLWMRTAELWPFLLEATMRCSGASSGKCTCTLFRGGHQAKICKSCHHHRTVIVMTFWYAFGTDLTFSNFFNFISSLGIDHEPPCSLYSHDLCLFLFPYVSFFTRSHGQEKSLSYYDLFDFGVLTFYGRILTLILFYFLHNSTTPILPVYVDQGRPHLEKDTTRTRSVVIRKIPAVPRRTRVTPD